MLGTGRAQVTECYNTCFVLEEDGACMLVDGGGGGQLLHQLKASGYRWQDMRDIFVTHRHIDHILGIVWMLRMFCQNMKEGKIAGEVRIYGHDEVIRILHSLAEQLLQPKEIGYIDTCVHLICIEDGEEREILGHRIRFFDIHSKKAKQFGFIMDPQTDHMLVCCGDEPCGEHMKEYVRNARWMLHEAFCLYEDREMFHPYEKSHSTVKDACELAQELGIGNLLLYHTEDTDLKHRKQRYTAEGERYYSGRLLIPDDLEAVEL